MGKETRIIVHTGPVLNVLLMMTVMELDTVQMETVSVDQDQVQVQETPLLPEHHHPAMMILYAIMVIVLIAVPTKQQLKEVGKDWQLPIKQPSNQLQHSTIMPMLEFLEFVKFMEVMEFMEFLDFLEFLEFLEFMEF